MTFFDGEENAELSKQQVSTPPEIVETRLKLWNKAMNGIGDFKELMDEAFTLGLISQAELDKMIVDDRKEVYDLKNENSTVK